MGKTDPPNGRQASAGDDSTESKTLPGRRLKRGTATVPTSLDVVEHFMGEKLGRKVIRAVARLPFERALLLQDRLGCHAAACTAVFEERTGVEPGEETFADWGTADDVRLYQPLAGNLTVHERSLDPGRSTSLADIGVLRHLALYNENTLVDDPVPAWPAWVPLGLTEEDWMRRYRERWTRELATSLRELLPIADLIRSGCFVMLPRGVPSAECMPGLTHSASFPDIFSAWIIHHENPGLLHDLSTAYDGHARARLVDDERLTAQAAEVIRKLHEPLFDTMLAYYRRSPYRLSGDQVHDILRTSICVNMYNCGPVTSSPGITSHLRNYSRLTLEGEARFSPAHEPLSPIGSAIAYRVPSLAGVSFADIARLRQNEERFAQLRAALVRLAEVATATGQPEGYEAYAQTIRQIATDIVGDTYRDLHRWRRKARWGKWGSSALGGLVSLGIDGLVGIPLLGDLVGKPLERLVGRRSHRNLEDATVALRIMQTVMPE